MKVRLKTAIIISTSISVILGAIIWLLLTKYSGWWLQLLSGEPLPDWAAVLLSFTFALAWLGMVIAGLMQTVVKDPKTEPAGNDPKNRKGNPDP